LIFIDVIIALLSYIVYDIIGKPWLWARLDRKPNKAAEKRFRKYQSQQKQDQASPENMQPFSWNVEKDFKVSLSMKWGGKKDCSLLACNSLECILLLLHTVKEC